MAEMIKKKSSNESSQVSARQKALQLGRVLGLASEADYRPSNASINERGQFRLQKQLNQHQENLEAIFALALNYTPSDVTGVELDPDWRYQFFKMAEQIHNRKMQDLWARILSSEIVNPGQFSLRTLAVLTQLTLREAHIFEKALGLAVKINNETRFKLLSGYRITGGLKQYFRRDNAISIGLSKFGLPYSSILTLVDAGILHKSEFETGVLESKTPITLNLNAEQLLLSPKSKHLLFTYYRFTPIGDELSQLIQAQGDSQYINTVQQVLSKDFTA
ncbi:TIGR03899 family protein [Shewanella intestini]|uniref:TIGR03899 family protein n=1 Tax=Shewanella intestini TaxID=2017544 RepID=A0ABS5I612_9GAMM|nr:MULTISPECIES: TIGR03899 family protein [Shewanella]MBR9729458.1 TIGR03899 family protein [Shewanella intestini]MRG35081.1 TIGR03899 family protein [Shewanella sp. XMDDZSB0408]